MKNLTITLDDDTAQWIRVEAARQNASVSRLVGEILREQRLQETEYLAAAERYLGRTAQRLKAPSQHYPSRDALHEQ